MRIIALDIETTGQHYLPRLDPYLGRDELLAIGACVGELGEDGTYTILSSKKWVLRLRKPINMTWEELWIKKGFERRCYDEFWSKHLHVLEHLQDVAAFNGGRTMMEDFNSFLREQERLGEFSLLFDTLLFDSVWLDNALRTNGYVGLSRKRDGTGWRSAYEMDSIRFGLSGARLGDWKELETRTAALKAATISPEGELHDPEYDACDMFLKLARAYTARQ